MYQSRIMPPGSWIWENQKNLKNLAKNLFSPFKKCKLKSKEHSSNVLSVHPWLQKVFFWPEMSIITKWRSGEKTWGYYIVWHYFAEYLTPILTLGLHLYRNSNLVLDLKIWEKIGVKSLCVHSHFCLIDLVLNIHFNNVLVL